MAARAREPLLVREELLLHDAEFGQVGRVREPPVEVSRGHGLSLLTVLGFWFLTFNSGMAIYRSNGDYGAIAFVAFSYFDLIALFYCLRLYEREGDRSPTRSKLKACVWVLTTLLAIMFSYQVATAMPLAAAVIVWAMVATTVVGVYYAFFRR